jgi:murein DD-endopeptidase MepM/ murein hydrolase activator NlpD
MPPPEARIRELGRLGSNAVRPGQARMTLARHGSVMPEAHWSYVRRQPRLSWPLTAVLSITILTLMWIGAAASTQTDPSGELHVAAVAGPPARPDPSVIIPQPASQGDQRQGKNVFARVRGLALTLPHPHPIAVAFHEASREEALAIEPIGNLIANDNPSRFTPAQDLDALGPDYRVLSSRGRPRPPTSAVDIVVPKGARVAAPVTGRIVEVSEYPLYHQTLDWRVVIAPASHPGLRVVLIHLERPEVEVGDGVVAGETPLAVAHMLGFTSHVDYVTEQRLPHTHIEVKAVAEPRHRDPNALASPR